MKIIKFREVLFTIASKIGFDPEQGNFLTNQAISIGRYIDQWVRRTYDGRDWPELVVTREFEPASHIVPYEGIDDVYGSDQAFRLGRVLNVYLIDPRTTAAPVSTDFSMLMSGVHCGHEHGSSVWMRYMFPAPRYTAEVWDAGRSYLKDEVTYSPLSGECYRSRVNGNMNHDPGRSFQLPPLPPDMDPPEPESDTPPDVTIVQEYIAHDPGNPGQTKIMLVDLTRAGSLGIPDPATALDYFNVVVLDVDGVGLGSANASGPNTLVTIAAQLVAALNITLPASFTVAVDTHVLNWFTIEDLSDFSVQPTYTHFGSGLLGDVTYNLRLVQRQTYVAPRPFVEGQSQITNIQLTSESTIPGGTYRVTMTGAYSTPPVDTSLPTNVVRPHTVEYASAATDGMPQIIDGLAAAMDSSADVFWEGVIRQAYPDQGLLSLEIFSNASTSAAILLLSDPYWEWNPFPLVLAEAVIRGSDADVYKEWGQNDKGAAEEGVVPQEMAVNEGKFSPSPILPLSGQQVPISRYRG